MVSLLMVCARLLGDLLGGNEKKEYGKGRV